MNQPFAFERPFLSEIGKPFELATVPHLNEAWNRTRSSLQCLSESILANSLEIEGPIVFASGSLGRMEQHVASDADLVFLGEADDPANESLHKSWFDRTWQVIEGMGFERPKPNGIFGSPASKSRLLDPKKRGQIDEDVFCFGRRIQSLLDSQPLINPGLFRDLQSKILAWYFGKTSIDLQAPHQPYHDWEYLLNDLGRYQRSLSIRTRWLPRNQQGGLVRLKWHHSRKLNYVGLLTLLGESSKINEPITWILDRLTLTPLERILFFVNQEIGNQILKTYDRFLFQLEQIAIALEAGHS